MTGRVRRNNKPMDAMNDERMLNLNLNDVRIKAIFVERKLLDGTEKSYFL